MREPDNAHDPNAIKVVLAPPSGLVGHVPKETAKWLSPLIASGLLSATAVVANDAAQNNDAKRIAIVIQVLGFGPGSDKESEPFDEDLKV